MEIARIVQLPLITRRPRSRFRPRTERLVLIMAVCSALLVSPSAWGQLEEADPEASSIDRHELFYGAHLPRNRAVSRALDLADDLLKQRRYSEAASLLLETLELPEDSLDLRGDHPSDQPASLKQRARRLLADLSPSGRRAYQLEVETPSQRALSKATDEGDLAAVLEVSRRYPGTLAAATADWLLAIAAIERGDYELAIAAANRLRESPVGGDFEPQRSLLAATAEYGLGNLDRAQRLVEAISQSVDSTSGLVGGVSPSDRTALGAKLAALVDAPTLRPWSVRGGGPRRNPERAGEPPHPWARWTALAVVDPREEDRLSQYAYHLQSQHRSTAPASAPVAAGDLVFMRTAENLVAIDFRTGRRVWETRSERTDSRRGRFVSRRRRNLDDAEQALLTQETVRTWFDGVQGGVSTDGRRVYVVEPVQDSSANEAHWSAFQLQRGQFDAILGEALNRLSAYDLATEGKLAWSIGAGQKGELAGAYFLSVPQPFGHNLAAVVEVDQTISLVELDAATGAVLWRQPLVSIERGVKQNSMRRLVGAATAQAGSILYCSTGAGVVVAVDVQRRSLLWVDRFPVEEGRRASTPLPWRRRSRDPWPQNIADSWHDNRVIVAGDRVVVASPESPLVHCLQRATGKLIWRVEREEGVSLLAVTGGKVFVSESQAIRALDLVTGKVDWKAGWEGDAVISGRGVVLQNKASEDQSSEDQLLAPLSDGSFVEINPQSGDLLRRLTCWSGSGAGNLIVHRGAILSQTYNSLDRYDQSGPLFLAAQRKLQENPAAVTALCVIGESLLSAGEVDGAIGRFATAYQADPQSPLVRDRLRRALALRLREKGPNPPDLALLEQLVDAPEQRIALRVQAISLVVEQGNLSKAVDLAIEFAESEEGPDERGEGLVAIAKGHFAAPAARVAALLGAAWKGADATTQQRAMEAIAAASEDLNTMPQFNRMAQVFSETPAAMSLEERLVARLEAEEFLLPLAFHRSTHSRDPPGLPDASSSSTWPGVETRWATHDAVVRTTPRELADPAQRFPNRRDRSPGWRRLSINDEGERTADRELSSGIVDLAIDTDSGLLVGYDGDGTPVYRSQLRGVAAGFVRQSRNEEELTIWRLGPCLYFTGSNHVAALETLPGRGGDDRRLWSTDSLSQSIARATRAASAEALGPVSERLELEPSEPVAILSVSPRGVVVRCGEVVASLDPLTGIPRWIRSDPEFLGGVSSDNVLTSGNELYAVTHVIHSHAGRSKQENRGRRWSMVDGSDAGDWQPPKGEWLATHGGAVVTLQETSPGRRLTVTRVSTGEKLLVRDYDSSVLVDKTESGDIVTLQPSGRIELIESGAGRVVVNALLPLRAAPRSFNAVLRQGRLVVIVAPQSQPVEHSGRLTPLDAGGAIVSDGLGEVHCIDLTTGELAWPRPALVSNRGWALRQPRDSPLLVFGARVDPREKNRRSIQTSLLVLDLFSGRTILRDDEIADNAAGSYQIRYEAGPSPEMQIVLPQHRVTLTLTDSPAAPALPANDLAETGIDSPAGGGFLQQFQQLLDGSITVKPEEDDD